jgi:ribosomal protein S18 acetylase RimI-like enzyme
MEIKIMRYTVGDVPRDFLRQISTDCFSGELKNNECVQACDHMPGSLDFVAFVEGVASALVTASWRPTERSLYLFNIGTLPCYRRNGLAKRILDEVSQYAKDELDAKSLKLFMWQSNTNAGSLYRACGFHPTKRGKKYGRHVQYFRKLCS